jgi:hypothetical protein
MVKSGQKAEKGSTKLKTQEKYAKIDELKGLLKVDKKLLQAGKMLCTVCNVSVAAIKTTLLRHVDCDAHKLAAQRASKPDALEQRVLLQPRFKVMPIVRPGVEPVVVVAPAARQDALDARCEELRLQIVASLLALNIPLEPVHALLTGSWLDAVIELRAGYGGVPSLRVLREYVPKAGEAAIALIKQQVHADAVSKYHGVMTDSSSDAHGHAIVNTIINSPVLGEVLVGSHAVTDDSVLGSVASAAIAREALAQHDIVPALPFRHDIKAMRGSSHACAAGQHLDHQVLSGVSTDNCTTAKGTADKILEAARADCATTFAAPAQGEERNADVLHDTDLFNFVDVRCLPHSVNLLCSGDVLAFVPSAKRLLELLSAVAGTKSRQRVHRLLQKLEKASDRHVLDSDGQRWGDRLRVLLLLFRQRADKPEYTIDSLRAWVTEEAQRAEEDGKELGAQLRELNNHLNSPYTLFEARLLHWLFGELPSILKATQSTYTGSLSLAHLDTLAAVQKRLLSARMWWY